MSETTPVQIDGEQGDISGKQFVVIVSTYNRPITGKLLDGTVQTLFREGASGDNIRVLWVPGAWELAVAAKRVIVETDAVICLGCVIRGETTHDQHINTMISQSLGQLSVENTKPVAFGVLTCNTVDQAMQRSGGAVGNKGEEAAMAAIAMLRLFDQLA